MGWLDQRVELRALLAGVAADWLGTTITLPLLALAYGLTPETAESRLEELQASATFLLALILHGACFTSFGGYVAARLAPGSEMRHAAIVGILAMVLAAAMQFPPPEGPAPPVWAVVLGYLLAVPAALAGGWLALRREVR